MVLTACCVGCEAKIVKILAKEPLRGRLQALGVSRGADVKVLERTLTKETWEIECEGVRIALRDEEAALIEVVPKEEHF